MPSVVDAVRRRVAKEKALSAITSPIKKKEQLMRFQKARQVDAESRFLESERVAEKDQLARERQKFLKEKSRIVSLIMKEKAFYQQNKIEIEALQKEVDSVIQRKKLGVSETVVKRIAVNLDYMLRTTAGMNRLNAAQKLDLVRNVALEIGIQIAQNPSVRSGLRRDVTAVNLMVRETFNELIQQQ